MKHDSIALLQSPTYSTQQKEYEKALMDLLIAYVPRLLKRTDFFAKAFY